MTNPPKLEVVTSELDILSDEIAARQSTARAADLGKLSADAVMATYQAAATAVASLEEPLRKRTHELAESMLELNAAAKEVMELAARINEAGHLEAARIAAANTFSTDVRRMIGELAEKVK